MSSDHIENLEPTDAFFSDDTVVWERLSDIVEKFSEAWNAAPEPELAEHVPNDETNFRRLALIELIKVDLEYRAADTKYRKSLEEYFTQWPILIDDGLPPLDLIYEEIQIQKQHGRDVSIETYIQKYPKCETALLRLTGEETELKTSIFQTVKIKEYDPGEVVDDFQIVSRLGQGAFATVYLARQISMQRLVALKVSADKGIEHQMLAQMDHPHIVRVYDVRKLADTGARLMYMQYVSGGTLQEAFRFVKQSEQHEQNGKRFLDAIDIALVDRGELPPQDSENRKKIGQMDWPRTVSFLGSQLADALAFAHKQNILHRDLKPANVLVTANGMPKLVDFNISHCSKIDGVSPAAYFGGSLAYMSPEQLEAFSPNHERLPDELDQRADIYSLGCMIYELLVGTRPFEPVPNTGDWQKMLDDLIRQRTRGMQQGAQTKLEGSPKLLADALQRSLNPDPNERFDSAKPMARQLAWATDPEIERAVIPSKGTISSLIQRFPILTMMAIAVAISGFSAWFIFSYNVIESVPKESHRLFFVIQAVINGIAFPSALVFLYFIGRVLSRNIRLTLAGAQISGNETKRAIDRCLIIGHLGSIVCVALWAIAGTLYPLTLTAFGVEMTSQGWIDFMGSHLLAGLIAGSFSFFAASFFAARFWLPILFLNFLRLREIPDIQANVKALSRHLNIHQFIVVLIPMLSVALLVVWGDAQSKFALAVVSVAAVIGIPIVFFAAQHLAKRLDVIGRMISQSES